MPASTALLNKVKGLSPTAKKALLAFVGTLIGSAPFFIPALAPLAIPLATLGGVFGGVVIRSPGDVKAVRK